MDDPSTRDQTRRVGRVKVDVSFQVVWEWNMRTVLTESSYLPSISLGYPPNSAIPPKYLRTRPVGQQKCILPALYPVP